VQQKRAVGGKRIDDNSDDGKMSNTKKQRFGIEGSENV
jgi:hypothetical protein